MEAQVKKWGNSLAVRIPGTFAKQAGLKDGAAIDVSVEEGKLVISPAKKKYSLRELVAKITPENRHEEVSTGGPVGNEEW